VIAEFYSFELKDEKARYFRDCAVKYIELLADRLDDLGIKSIKKCPCRTNPVKDTEKNTIKL
jgi:hypothetical protein